MSWISIGDSCDRAVEALHQFSSTADEHCTTQWRPRTVVWLDEAENALRDVNETFEQLRREEQDLQREIGQVCSVSVHLHGLSTF